MLVLAGLAFQLDGVDCKFGNVKRRHGLPPFCLRSSISGVLNALPSFFSHGLTQYVLKP